MKFTPREVKVLKQLFEVWKLESGETVADAIKNIYDQPYIKDFKPNDDQIKLGKHEFDIFVRKLFNILGDK